MEKVRNYAVKTLGQVETTTSADTELDDAALDAVSGGCEKSEELFNAVALILKQQNQVNLAVFKMIRL